jgi:hypothetical protein
MHLFGHTRDHDYYFELPREGERDAGVRPFSRFSRSGPAELPTPDTPVPEGSFQTFFSTFFLYGHHRHRIAIV